MACAAYLSAISACRRSRKELQARGGSLDMPTSQPMPAGHHEHQVIMSQAGHEHAARRTRLRDGHHELQLSATLGRKAGAMSIVSPAMLAAERRV